MRYFSAREQMVVAMEVGTHSPRMSRLIQELGHEALVANARKLRFIYGNDQKDDDVDAEMLARVARLDRKLLSPIEHRTEADAGAMALLRSRDALVRTLTSNHLPLCVLLRDIGLTEAAAHVPTTELDAFRTAAAGEILAAQARMVRQLQQAGVLVVETMPNELAAVIINQYLDLKARHRL